MNSHAEALRLINDLLDDFSNPGFVWQVVALSVCLGAALVFSRWWRSGHQETRGRLRDAGARLVFPFTGMLLAGLAIVTLKQAMPVNLLRLVMPLLGSMALVRGVVFVLRQAFPHAQWLTTWERVIATLVWCWLALHITDLLPFVIDALEDISFTVGQQRLNLWVILRGIVTVFLTVIVALWGAGIIENRLMRVSSLDNNLRIVGVRVAKAVLTVLAILVSLSLAGIDMTALSVFTGALGVGLGFGLQKIANNYVSGFIILLERSIRIGNIVQVGNDSGVVTQITTRYTVLQHPGGSEFIVPNETLISSTVQNQTYTDKRLRLATTVGVAYDCDLPEAMRLMAECARAQPRVMTEPAPRVSILQFADSAINLELGFWIEDPENGKGNVVSDINLAIWQRFRDNGISIPFPQREVRLLNPSGA